MTPELLNRMNAVRAQRAEAGLITKSGAAVKTKETKVYFDLMESLQAKYNVRKLAPSFLTAAERKAVAKAHGAYRASIV